MTDNVRIDDTARRVAARLVPDLEQTLPAQVERALAEDPLDRPAERLIDPISLGALIVSIVSLGWTIYHDQKQDWATAASDQAKDVERLTAELRAQPEAECPPNITPEQHQLIIATVADEIVRDV
ncbi:MAG: hypothetical protein ACREE9_21640 [Stellaceae bacterium]